MRLWDGRIGRWLTTDPKKQHASPYLGMGNNPMNKVDPDGGFELPPGEGEFDNGFVWTDSDGSWEFQNGTWIGVGDSKGWDMKMSEVPNFLYVYEVGEGWLSPGHSLLVDVKTGLGMEIFHPTNENGEIESGVKYFFSNDKKASQYYTWQVFEPGTITPFTGKDSGNQGKNFWKNGGIGGNPRAPVGLKVDFLRLQNRNELIFHHYVNLNFSDGFSYVSGGVCSTYVCRLIDIGKGNNWSLWGRFKLPNSSINRFTTGDFEKHIQNPF